MGADGVAGLTRREAVWLACLTTWLSRAPTTYMGVMAEWPMTPLEIWKTGLNASSVRHSCLARQRVGAPMQPAMPRSSGMDPCTVAFPSLQHVPSFLVK